MVGKPSSAEVHPGPGFRIRHEIDLITPDIEQPLDVAGGAVIEVNADPGLHHHYNIVDPPGPTPVAERILERLLGASAAETAAPIAAMDAAPRR